MNSLVPVILVGGSGSRLWPLSFEKKTKPFIRFFDQENLAQQTLNRLIGLKIKKVLIICNVAHIEHIHHLYTDFPIEIIVEKHACNTAAAAGIASLNVERSDKILLLPSDHLIREVDEFQKTVMHALENYNEKSIFTFCKKPKSSNVNYGYLEIGKNLKNDIYEITRFVEKPNRLNAELYFLSNNYFWNCGIYLFEAKIFLKELAAFEPEILNACKKAEKNSKKVELYKNVEILLSEDKKTSIDVAIMEKTKFISAILLRSDWNDLGVWDNLDDASKNFTDQEKNYISGEISLESTKNSFVISDRKTVLQGLENIFVISSEAGLLVSDKSYLRQKMKIPNDKNDFCKSNQFGNTICKEEKRPWGSYQVLSRGEGFQSKILKILPNEKISLQKHHHRSEHWVILEGLAKIIKDDKTFMLQENESTFIPIGTKHSIQNISSKVLKIFEVQTGNFLSESDIVRYNDKYGRK